MKRSLIALLLVWGILVASIPIAPAQQDARPLRSAQTKRVTIPSDTLFKLKLNTGLSSRTAQKGDTFTAKVIAPVTVGHDIAVPEGSVVYGHVTSVTKAARRKNGEIAVTFDKLELASKRTYEVLGSLASLEDEKGEKREVGEEGEVKGKSTTKRNVVFIGGGAGVGAAIGAAAGGGKGAGIGAAIGAGVGAAGALLSKGNEVEVASGTEIGMVLDKALTVTIRR
jgi:type IV secretion system protein VirB10